MRGLRRSVRTEWSRSQVQEAFEEFRGNRELGAESRAASRLPHSCGCLLTLLAERPPLDSRPGLSRPLGHHEPIKPSIALEFKAHYLVSRGESTTSEALNY